MEKIKFPRDIRVYIPLLVLFFVLFYLLPRAGKFNYEFQKGQPWMYDDLYATFEVPVLKSAAQEKEDREQVTRDQPPFYYKDSNVPRIADEMADKLPPTFALVTKASLKKIYAKGFCDQLNTKAQTICCYEISKLLDTLPVVDVYTTERARRLLESNTQLLFESDTDSAAVENIKTILERCLLPNLIYDETRTRSELNKALDNIAHTSGVIHSGERIIARGEVVTARKEQLLRSYRLEFDKNYGYDGKLAFLWMSNAFIALLLVALLFFSILFTNAKIFADFHRYIYLLMIFLLTQLCIFLVGNPNFLHLYMVPFSLMTLFLLSFFRKKVVLPVYLVSLFPMLILPMGVRLFFVWASAGVLNIFTFTYFSKGWKQFVNAFFTFLLMASVLLAFQFSASGVNPLPLKEWGRLLMGSFLAVAGYPLIYLFEKLFSLVSTHRLDDLSDTNSPLLQLLSRTAPGTYQHSLQVMNMSEAVARAVGADVSLIRAGALYHDVGKIQNPQCFVENQLGSDDFHKGLSYEESARMIIRHIADGEVIAEKYGLPAVVKRFIRSHHGTSCTGYFYGKFVEEGGDPERKEEFCYPGPKPVSAEETVVMICDSIEAASRTLKVYSDESIAELVDRIVDGKMREGQFSETELSLSQLEMAKKEICNYLHQIHHARIVYPNINNINK
ncbi:MAG: HDIG domain-containing protein [Bacteroidales bacterium]|nr:HDIG domain-containing protein [Bacteroidales bacterium]